MKKVISLMGKMMSFDHIISFYPLPTKANIKRSMPIAKVPYIKSREYL